MLKNLFWDNCRSHHDNIKTGNLWFPKYFTVDSAWESDAKRRSFEDQFPKVVPKSCLIFVLRPSEKLSFVNQVFSLLLLCNETSRHSAPREGEVWPHLWLYQTTSACQLSHHPEDRSVKWLRAFTRSLPTSSPCTSSALAYNWTSFHQHILSGEFVLKLLFQSGSK